MENLVCIAEDDSPKLNQSEDPEIFVPVFAASWRLFDDDVDVVI